MTLVQLEYVVALATYQHFAKAAAHAHVTQPTLSMQIGKLEEELGVQLFDRSKQPVMPTLAGLPFIEKARQLLRQRDELMEEIQPGHGPLSGNLRIGVIPTLAPYLLPLFVGGFTRKFPDVHLSAVELTTGHLITHLKEGRVDAGILVTPLKESGLREEVLFHEELLAYVSPGHRMAKKEKIQAGEIDAGEIWLLEEGHCFRSQTMNLCELRSQNREVSHFNYEAGNIETLKKMVDLNGGLTILPELATLDLNAKQKALLRPFKSPAPMRQVSLVMHRHFVKKRLIETLKTELLAVVPSKIRNNRHTRVVPIELLDSEK